MEDNFKEFKKEILKRAKKAKSCMSEYKRALQSETFAELIQVIKDNISFAANRHIIDFQIMETYKNQFNENDVFCNIGVRSGFLLACGNATVKSWQRVCV